MSKARKGGAARNKGPGGLEIENMKFPISYLPRERYPPMVIPPLISTPEYAEIAEIMTRSNERARNSSIYCDDGPLLDVYLRSKNKNRVSKNRLYNSHAVGPNGKFDAFNAMGTYSQKYKPPVRSYPELPKMLWFKKFMPEELWYTIDPDVPCPPHILAMKGEDDDEEEVAPITTRSRMSRIVDEDKEENEDEDEDGEEKEVPEDELDENWEDDEDEDMDYEKGEKDDYNAEQYFDNGEDHDFGGDDGDGEYE